MRFLRNEDGTSPLVGLMVGLVVFTATFSYVVFVAVEDGQNSTSNPQAALDGKAASMASLAIQPGVGWYDLATACTGDPLELDTTLLDGDPVADGRFGLGRENCEDPSSKMGDVNLLDYAKVINLRNARLAADPDNDYADYEEARRGLGLDEANLDFHIRSEPVLANIRDLLRSGFKDPNLRPLYIGDYVKTDGGGGEVTRLVPHTAGVVEDTDAVTLFVDITNDGTVDTIFEVQFTIPLASGSINVLYHTPVVTNSGDTHRAEVTIPMTADWTWADSADPTVDYTISDVDGGVGDGEISLSGVDMDAPSDELNHVLYFAHADKLQWLSDGTDVDVKVHYDAFTGTGEEAPSTDWGLYIYDSTGDPAGSDTSLNSRGWESFTVSSAETFRADLKSNDGTVLWNSDRLNVVSTEVGAYTPSGGGGTWTPAGSVPTEMGYITAIIEQFQPNVFSTEYHHTEVPNDGTLPDPPDPGAGDVYPDVKHVMNNDVPAVLIDENDPSDPQDDEATLENYNVVMVGSNVDHQVMTSAAAKQTIRDWVYAGGLLIVLGSTEQAVQWLQPIFHSALDSAGGGISTPDPNHPVLNVPNELDYEAYETHGIVWSYTRDQDADHFTHVITEGEDDYLALSNPGQFGDGRVLLASYQPFDLTGDQEAACNESPPVNCEPMRMIHNFVTIAYQGLYIDYGPPLPTDRPHGSAVRLAAVDHPELDQRVAVKIFVYVF